jgi:hypothetical protein
MEAVGSEGHLMEDEDRNKNRDTIIDANRTYLFETADPVVVGAGPREAVGGFAAADKDGARGQQGEAARGDPALRVEAVYDQLDLRNPKRE